MVWGGREGFSGRSGGIVRHGDTATAGGYGEVRRVSTKKV